MPRELDLIPRLLAFQRGRAVRHATHLQVAVRPDALVVCPLAMAGEDTTVQVVAWGGRGEPPVVRFVPDPRHRDDQYALFADFGAAIERHFLACRAAGTHPQLWVSSAPVAAHLDTLADRLRYSRDDARVRRFGELLSYATERYPVAGQQALLTATGALRLHWATGQTEGEDEHLAALLTWIAPPVGRDVLKAVGEAALVPMGVKTDPQFDRETLEPLVTAYNEARRAGAGRAELARHADQIGAALQPVVLHIFDATQRALQILAGMPLPPLPDLPQLERRESQEFASFMDSRDAGYGLTLRDGPKASAFKLSAREDAAQNLEAARLVGDSLARASGRLTGRIVVGTVARSRATKVGPHQTRYEFELHSTQRVLHLRVRDELCWLEDPRLRVVVTRVQRSGSSAIVSVQIAKGQRAVGLPREGSRLELVPGIPDWEWLWRLRGHLSRRLAVTPWTHTDGPSPTAPARPAPLDPLAAVEALR